MLINKYSSVTYYSLNFVNTFTYICYISNIILIFARKYQCNVLRIMRFKDVLNKYGVTQQDLADRMGMNRVSVSRLLSEKNDLRISTIEKIANAIGCPVAELFGEQNKEDAMSDFIALIKQGGELYSASSIAEARVVLDKLGSVK